jgi:cytochrome c
MVLLRYLLILTYILFIPYISVLFGAAYLSLSYNKKGEQGGNKFYFKLAKDIIDLATINKSIAFALGIIPLLSATFCYAQLLSSGKVSLTGYLLTALLFLVAGLISLYSYKYSFHLKDIFGSVKEETEDVKNELNKYKNISESLFKSAGKWGFYLILIAVYIFFGAASLAIDPSRWESVSSIFSMIFSFSALLKFLLFVSFAFVTTSIVGVFYLNEELEDSSAEYKEFVKDNLFNFGLASGAAASFLYVIVFLVSPKASLADTAFIAAAFALFAILIVSSLIYLMMKEEGAKYINSAVTFLILFFIGFIVKEQSAFNSATVKPFYLAAEKYEKHLEEMKAEFGLGIVEISGEDIFNGRCVACHNFEQKLVGPAYNNVLPKYVNNQEGLVQFILNPTKVDPNFPPMPNQGLKPNEAQAIADYILNVYKENNPQ